MSLEKLFGYSDETPKIPDDQRGRRANMLEKMLGNSRAVARAADLVMDIIERNERRMKLDADGNLVIAGCLAFYKVNLNGFFDKFTNPFSYNSFDVVEVHPKSGMVEEPKTACVQVQPQPNMPAGDLLAGYILGLLNDEVTWLQEHLGPLRRTLLAIYGMGRSPLSDSLQAHFYEKMGGHFDFANDCVVVDGTNGWKWRVTFCQPLTSEFKIEYQKPRQDWWTTVFNEHIKESSGHYVFNSFFDTVEHLSHCPGLLTHMAEERNDWEADPIFLRKIAVDYPPLAKRLLKTIDDEEHYDPEKVSNYYDEYLEADEVNAIRQLDDQVRERAYA
ncbi:MAG: hypothetical protein QF531_00075 [Candidatus Poseidonia sp.]|nr:hypothetical protein [Poseidonia sp.]